MDKARLRELTELRELEELWRTSDWVVPVETVALLDTETPILVDALPELVLRPKLLTEVSTT